MRAVLVSLLAASAAACATFSPTPEQAVLAAEIAGYGQALLAGEVIEDERGICYPLVIPETGRRLQVCARLHWSIQLMPHY